MTTESVLLSEKGLELYKNTSLDQLAPALLRKVIEIYDNLGDHNMETIDKFSKIAELITDHYYSFGKITLYTSIEDLFSETPSDEMENPVERDTTSLEHLLYMAIKRAESDYRLHLDSEMEQEAAKCDDQKAETSQYFDQIWVKKRLDPKDPVIESEIQTLSAYYTSLENDLRRKSIEINSEKKKEGAKFWALKAEISTRYHKTGGTQIIFPPEKPIEKSHHMFDGWEEIFQNPKLMEEHNLVETYQKTIKTLAGNWGEITGRQIHLSSEEDYMSVIDQIVGMTIEELNQLLDAGDPKTFRPATRIISLIHRYVCGNFLPPSNFEQVARKMRKLEYDFERSIADILKGLSSSWVSDKNPLCDPDNKPIVAEHEDILRNTAKGIILDAKRHFNEIATLDHLNIEYPITGRTLDKLTDDASMRHFSEDTGHVLRHFGKKTYSELDAIIVYYLKTNMRSITDNRKRKKLLQALKQQYYSENSH